MRKIYSQFAVRSSQLIKSLQPAAVFASLVLSVGQLSAAEGDWPQWGGTNQRNMANPLVKGLPATFNPGKFKAGTEEVDMATTQHVKWAVKLGSQTYGNPVVANGRILVGTNNESPRNQKHIGDRGILYCFEEKTGNFLWQLVVPKLESGKVNDWEYLGITASPTVEGDFVYVVTNRCQVLCLDLHGLANGNQGIENEAEYLTNKSEKPISISDNDADIIWRYDMMDELGVFPHNAANCSVLIDGDLVYVATSNGQDWTHVNIPSPNSPSLIALNKKTGEFVAEDDAAIGPRIFHGGWSSPSMGVVNGKKQIFFGGADGVCYAFDPTPVPDNDNETAWLKKVWWFDCNPDHYKVKDGKKLRYPGSDAYSEIIATPVLYNNKVYIATGQDPEHGEGIGMLTCIDATKIGDVTKSAKLWSYDKIARSISTVSVYDGLVFVGDFSGFFFCLDAETGKEYWVHDLKAHMWGSSFAADGKVYVGDESGIWSVFAASKEKKIMSQVTLDSPIYATTIYANGTMYVACQTHLYAITVDGK
jgi:outer membrane protein assembly factor BamB